MWELRNGLEKGGRLHPILAPKEGSRCLYQHISRRDGLRGKTYFLWGINILELEKKENSGCDLLRNTGGGGSNIRLGNAAPHPPKKGGVFTLSEGER